MGLAGAGGEQGGVGQVCGKNVSTVYAGFPAPGSLGHFPCWTPRPEIPLEKSQAGMLWEPRGARAAPVRGRAARWGMGRGGVERGCQRGTGAAVEDPRKNLTPTL